MFSVKSYIISLFVVSIISGIFTSFTDLKGKHAPLIKMILGLFILITVVSPWTKFRLTDVTEGIHITKNDARSYSYAGSNYSEELIRNGITERIEAYILDKADSLGLDINVRVDLADESPYTPESVELSGYVSPYNKARIQRIIENDLGICEECQKWT